jgi:hypothetical protein
MRLTALHLAVVSALGLTTGTSWSQHALTMPMEIVHTSNPGMEPVSRGSVNVLRAAPSYSIVNVDGAVRTELSVGAVLERSSDTALSANRSDPRLGGSLQWSTPTSQLNLRGSLQDASTRTAEFESTGMVTVDSTQRTVEVGADWSQDLSPVTRLTFGAARTKVDYETPLLVGYRESTTFVTIERTLAEDTQVSVEARHGRLHPDDLTLFTDGTRSSLFLDYEAALSEIWSVDLGVGRVRTTGEARRNTNVGRLLLRYQGERLRSTLEWRREVAPSGSLGGYGRTDSYVWTNGFALTSETRLEVTLGQSKSLEERASTGRTAGVVLRSDLSQFWSTFVGYEDRQSTPADGRKARGRSVSIGLSYSHPDF